MVEPALNEDQRDALQEVANMAMGQAATRLSKLLGTFIELSVPRVRVVSVADASAALREMTGITDTVTAVRQGFRSDIKGEAIVLCKSSSAVFHASIAGWNTSSRPISWPSMPGGEKIGERPRRSRMHDTHAPISTVATSKTSSVRVVAS